MCVHFSGEIYSIHHILIQRERGKKRRGEKREEERKGKTKTIALCTLEMVYVGEAHASLL